MTDSFTSRLRLQQPTVGADNNTWGGITNTDWQLVDDAVCGSTTINLNGLSSYTLSAVEGGSDQARLNMLLFTGTPSGNVTVTLPASVKFGWARNGTSGNYSITFTNGGASTLVLPGGNGSAQPAQPYYSDPASGVFDLSFGQNSLFTNGLQRFPGGLIMQWGQTATTGTGGVSLTFPVAFPTALLSFTATIDGWSGSAPVPVTLASGQPTKSGINVVATQTQTGAYVTTGVGFNWMAIGY